MIIHSRGKGGGGGGGGGEGEREVITGVVDRVNFINEYFLNIIGNNFHISKLHEK